MKETVNIMTKLNQVLPLEKSERNVAYAHLTEAHRKIQQVPLMTGITRTYQARDDESQEALPPEGTRVQLSAEQAFRDATAHLTRLFDLTLTKDEANTRAKADVVVDGQTLLTGVPVSTLLFLEKQLIDLRTFAQKIPTLDAAELWSPDPTSGDGFHYRTEPYQTLRSKKVPRNHVKAEATDRHPAQVEVYYEDVHVGTWTTTKFSGALPAARKQRLIERIRQLDAAVKTAREEANQTEVRDQQMASTIFTWLFRE